MQITTKTRLKEVLPLISNKGMLEKILEDIDEYPLDKPIISMTIGEFSEIILDEQGYIQSLMKPNERAYKAFGRLKAFKREMEDISKWIQKHEVKQTEEERRAAIGVDFPNFVTKIMITCIQFFNLHSFKEAEAVPLADYLIILQDQSAAMLYQRNYSKILEQKQKQYTHGR